MKKLIRMFSIICCISIIFSLFMFSPTVDAKERNTIEGVPWICGVVKPVAAYASTTVGIAGMEASKAIDNVSEESFWSSEICASPGTDPQWIYIDLGRNIGIGRIDLTPRSHNGVPIHFPLDFKFQYSNDASTWFDIPGQSYSNYTDESSGVRVFTFNDSVQARYFRLYITRESIAEGNYYAQISDFEAFAIPTQMINEVTLVNAVASSTVGGTEWQAINVIDDNAYSNWSSAICNGSNPPGTMEQWIYVDVGSVKKITGFTMDQRWKIDLMHFPLDFKLQYSTDATNWTDIPGQSYTGYQNNPANLNHFGHFIFSSSVSARYIKVYVTKESEYNGDYYVQLSKIRVYSERDYSLLPRGYKKETQSGMNASSQITPYVAAYANDNDPYTFWTTQMDADGIVTEWISTDLGSSKSVGCIALTPRTINGVPAYFPLDFKIQSSNDGNSWYDVPGQVYKDYTTGGTTEDEVFTFALPVKARYIRVYVTKESLHDGAYYTQFRELKVYSTPSSKYNIETPLSVNASSTVDIEGMEAPKAIDGNPYSWWSSVIDADGIVSEWIDVDLGSNKNIGCIALKPRGGDGAPRHFPSDFKLQYSNDASTWTDVYGQSYTDYSAGENTNDQVFTFIIPVKARYFRLYITKESLYDGVYYAQIAEFKLYSINKEILVEDTAASTSASSSEYTDKVQDLNYKTYWSSASSLNGNSLQTIYANLGGVKNVSCVALVPRTVNGTPYCFPVDFKIQHSKDAVTWTDVAGQSYTNYSLAGSIADQVFTFSSPVEAKFIRVYITKESQYTNSLYYAQLAEIKVYSSDTDRIEIAPNSRIITPENTTEDIIVADYVVTDAAYNADPSGSNDSTSAIQTAIDDCNAFGGGTVWLPSGTYKITGTLYVKPYVTLRGDWVDPDITSGSYGTVISAQVATGGTGPVVFEMSGNSSVEGVAVYYPNQDESSPVEYNYTFRVLGRGLIGDWSCYTIQNITLINSYRGIGLSPYPYNENEHQTARVRNVKGTVLKSGMEINDVSNCDVFTNITFKNTYWVNAGTSFNPPVEATLDTWTRANGTAFTVSGMEWPPLYKLYCQDYNIGINLISHPRIDSCGPFLYCTVLDTNTAVSAVALDERWGIGFLRSTLSGSSYSVNNTSLGYVKLTDCITSGAKTGDVRTYMPGTSLASYPEQRSPKITRSVLYDAVTSYNAPYSLPNSDILPRQDATTAIQNAINAASSAGGGIVYLRAGWYRIDGHLTIPENVELRGSSPAARDNFTSSLGTVLMCYEGKNTATPDTATAAVTMSGNSGIRSIRFFYPEANPADYDEVDPYPYTLRLSGSNIYVADIGFTISYNAIDASTSVCDNHYIYNIQGTILNKGISVRLDDGDIGRIETVSLDHCMAVRNRYSDLSLWSGRIDLLPVTRANVTIVETSGTSTSMQYLLNISAYAANKGIRVKSGNAYIYNIIMDYEGTCAVQVDSGATATVMNMMQYDADQPGSGSTIGTGNVTVYNNIYLQDEPDPLLMPNPQGDVLVFTATSDASSEANNKYIYYKAANVSRTWQSGDYIEYDVKVDMDSNVKGTEAAVGGIDIHNTDSTNFRDYEWADQCGHGGHPCADISAYAVDMWYHRKLQVPASVVGKTGAYLDVAIESDKVNTAFTAMYDNIVVTNGGNTVATVYASGTPSQNSEDSNNMYSGVSLTIARLNAFETENRTVTMSAGDTHVTTSDANMSHASGDVFSANDTNDYIEYTIPVPEAGTYNVKYKVNKSDNRGRYQLAIDGTDLGSVQDTYSANSTYAEIDLGNVSFSTIGNKLFRFKCTGKNASSYGYGLFLDHVLLTKQ